MISDVMFETVEGVRSYLEDPSTSRCYPGELRARIVALAIEADAIRMMLDCPPGIEPPPEAFINRAIQLTALLLEPNG